MTIGEVTLLKIVADESDMEAARLRFHIAFPSQGLSDLAFEAVVRNLSRRGLIRRDRQGTRLLLTETGRESLGAHLLTEDHAVRELSE